MPSSSGLGVSFRALGARIRAASPSPAAALHSLRPVGLLLFSCIGGCALCFFRLRSAGSSSSPGCPQPVGCLFLRRPPPQQGWLRRPPSSDDGGGVLLGTIAEPPPRVGSPALLSPASRSSASGAGASHWPAHFAWVPFRVDKRTLPCSGPASPPGQCCLFPHHSPPPKAIFNGKRPRPLSGLHGSPSSQPTLENKNPVSNTPNSPPPSPQSRQPTEATQQPVQLFIHRSPLALFPCPDVVDSNTKLLKRLLRL